MKIILLSSRQKPFINLAMHRATVALLEDGEGAGQISCSLEEEESKEHVMLSIKTATNGPRG